MIKKIFLGIFLVLLFPLAIAIYLYNLPHRDVQSTRVFEEIEATTLVNETLANPEESNMKYLEENGDSKVIIVKGVVHDIYDDQKGQKVVVLKNKKDRVGVSCTFMEATNKKAEALKVGELVRIKGVFRSGGEIDEELGLYEDVIIEKCALIE